jgi:hypothetical protein
MPWSVIVDPSANFMPGMMAQLIVVGNTVSGTVSNGVCPIGIIDDIKTRAFTANAWNEVKIAPAIGIPGPGGQPITPIDVVVNLSHAYIVPQSFVSTVDVELNQLNGTITFPAGTLLNYDLLGTGIPNALQTVVNYSYQLPNIVGDDSTIGSNRMTIWFQRMIFQTDQFETNQVYPVGANLYCSENGLFTTRRPTSLSPAVALCTAPPLSFAAASSMIEGMWL